ncbi:MAG TPA: TonB-dependent receptor [Blastocatellia bacterium]|nr:TonB-dependent receptor [Blastocatellia bacterium]
MRTSKIGLTVISLLLLTGMSVGVKAQAIYGSIIGSVTDPRGAAVSGATVTVTDLTKNQTTTVQTNDEGNYTVTHLIPGRYTVKIEAQGYKTSTQEVDVRADITARTDYTLQVGAVSEQVTVTADAQQLSLKTDRADVATAFNQRQLTELPILDRNFTKFLLLTPGTQQLGWQHASSENPQGSVQIMVNGQHFSGTSFQLDGTDNQDPILGIIVINPTLESAVESKITTQNYDAEFGLAIAGVVTAQTKSGSNDLHGSLFEFRRNDVTSARNPFSQSSNNALTGKAIPDTLWNQFGGSAGWRLKKDKNFIFGDFQGTRRKNGGSVLTTVPTALARTGDLSEYGRNIYDPTTGNSVGVGRTQFANRRIPANRLSQQALKLINLLPLPSPGRTGIENNFTGSGVEAFNSDQFDIRDDHYWSEKLHLFGRYSFARFDKSGPGAFGTALGGPAFDNIFFSGTSSVRNQSIASGFDYTMSTTTITDFRFGFFKYRVNVLPGGLGTTPASDAGIPGLNLDDFFTSGMPDFGIRGQGGFRFGYSLDVNQCNCPLDQQEQQFQFVNNWSFIHSNHTYKTGADIRYAMNLRVPSDAHRAGQLRFEPGRTSDFNANGTVRDEGLGIATFLLGDVSSFNRYVGRTTTAAERQRRWFFYGQDTWRATQKLTVNYGLRWELIFPERVKENGDGSLLNLESGNLFVGGVGDVNKNFNVDPTYKAFAPRLGIAYQLKEKTVVRAGYGRSFDIGVFGSLFGHTVTQNLPVLQQQDLQTSGFARVFTLTSGPPAPFFPAVPSNGKLPLPNGIFARARPFTQTLPTVDAWNVTVQHTLMRNSSVEVGYVGNKGTHVFAGGGPAFNVNQPVSDLSQPDADKRKPFFGKFGWTQGIDFFCNCADNRYNALQTKFETRFAGLSILAHYTYAAAKFNDGDYFIHDRSVSRGPTDEDRTHLFFFSNVWDLPIGRGKALLGSSSKTVDLILGGWQLNTVSTWASGLPFTPGVSGANCSVNSGPCRPDLTGDPDGDKTQFNWFKVGIGPGTPWAKAASGQFGNVGRNTLRGPHYFNTDASLFKKFQVSETKKLEFRIEAFNLFNHVNLGQPDSCVDCGSNAGHINGLAPGAQMRQFQFGLRFAF